MNNSHVPIFRQGGGGGGAQPIQIMGRLAAAHQIARKMPRAATDMVRGPHNLAQSIFKQTDLLKSSPGGGNSNNSNTPKPSGGGGLEMLMQGSVR